MQKEQLTAVMLDQLEDFNQKGISISDQTKLEDVFLPESNGPVKPKDLWKGFILFTIHKNTDKKKRFPNNWLTLTVDALADKLMILLILMFLSSASMAQLNINLGAVKTDLKNNAVNIGFSYLKSLDSTFGGQDVMVYGNSSFFMITPDVDFQTGNEDAFSSIIVKASGMFAKFKLKQLAGLQTPDATKLVHVFPVSVGAETNSLFNFINGIIEAGYSPWYHSPRSTAPDWLKHTKFGVFVQAGYKFKVDTNASKAVGGQVDESREDFNEGILRAKGNFSIDTRELIKIGGFKLGLVGSSDVWYDAMNSAFYYKLEGIARIFLNPQIYFDVFWNKGSGAPNFNQGVQKGVGLNVSF